MINKSEYRKNILERLKANEQQNAASDLLNASASRSQPQNILAEAAPAQTPNEIDQLLAIVRDKRAAGPKRAVALQKLDIAVSNSEALMTEVLSILGDNKEPAELRYTALKVLQQASFSSAVFLAKRPEFLNVLRSIVDDKDKQLREEALEILAIEKDEYAQRRLFEGLKTPSKALVAPEKAIQLLGYDVHADLFPVLRDIVEKSADTESKIEAVRILGADPGSKGLLQKVLQNKNEKKEIRATSAIAVQSISPQEFRTYAKQAVMDETEDSDIRAICLNALSLEETAVDGGGDPSGARAASSPQVDSGFEQYVSQLQGRAASEELKQAAAQYMQNKELKRNNPDKE